MPRRFRYSHAWAAGFFDGEGSVIICKDKRTGRTYIKVQVSQNKTLPLKLLQDKFGGSICSEGPGRIASKWSATGFRAIRFLRAVSGHLRTKHRVACVALAHEKSACQKYRDRCRNLVRRLNGAIGKKVR